MTSIPQLRKDLNDTQQKLFATEDEVKRLRKLSRSSQELEKALAEIKKLRAELEYARANATIRRVIVEVPVVKYRDNPKHIEMIRKLRGKP